MAENLSPMMKKYIETKKQYQDCILFYRLGDFYEMFFEDAITASRELELTLTGKSCGLEERAPMCGVPFHSANTYISRLVEKGYKIAICEQVEDPKTAKGIVRREVIRVVTPGTLTDEDTLNDKSNNYLCVICPGKGGKYGIAFADVSTGELSAAETDDEGEVINEIAGYSPAEIIAREDASASLSAVIKSRFPAVFSSKPVSYCTAGEAGELICARFGDKICEKPEMKRGGAVSGAVGMILKYLAETQKCSVANIDSIKLYSITEYMGLDVSARRNLELTETMRDRSKRGSLLGVLDRTKTSMGARLLKRWIERPLIDPIMINKRLQAVENLVNDMILRDEIEETLAKIYDISRIAGRIAVGSVTPKDLVALRQSLLALPELSYELSRAKAALLLDMNDDADMLEDVVKLLSEAVNDEVPATMKDGGLVRDGYNKELDSLRDAMQNGKQWLGEYTNSEKQRTGIKNLKVAYNKVFGYFIEVTKSNLADVPEDYIRKQTLTNCERFITPKLKELENTMLGAAERSVVLEGLIFDKIKAFLASKLSGLKKVCDTVAVTDVICSLAETADRNGYCMPSINSGGVIDIKNGRHPVVEHMMTDAVFVPNDTYLNEDDDRLLIITGPNMAGKSTYMRQTALIVLMAQMGSFVPAKSASIGIVDKIFTRVGAADDITLGQSTFMMEMAEVSNILKNATKNSLIILDEVGRGTGTFDGLSIAWSVAEYILNKRRVGAKTLFATHYHEMTQLEDMFDGVKNYRIAVKKSGDDITFLRKIVKGGTDDSYGIQVAALAGVPQEVIKRAKLILKQLEEENPRKTEVRPVKEEPQDMQIGFGDTIAAEIAEELKNTDVTTLTPIEALNMLYKLSNRAKEI